MLLYTNQHPNTYANAQSYSNGDSMKRYTVALSDDLKKEIRKRRILETYNRNNTISESDASFCESIDWHPVDELPVKEEVVDKIKSDDKSSRVKVKDVADIFRSIPHN